MRSPSTLIVPGLLVLLATSLLGASLPGQGAAPKLEDDAAFRRAQAAELHEYAELAFKGGFPGAARPVWLELLSEYDPDHAAARERLGFARVGTAWVPRREFEYPEGDNPNASVANRLRSKWESVVKEVGGAHKTQALASAAQGLGDKARYHYARALRFLPEDQEVQTALGHKTFGGLSGSELEEELFQRSKLMREVVDRELKTEHAVAEVSDAPPLAILEKAGVPAICVKSEHFIVWGQFDPDVLKTAAQHAERALAFCEAVFTGHSRFTEKNLTTRTFVFLKGEAVYKKVIEANKDLLARPGDLEFLLENTAATKLGSGAGRVRLCGMRAEPNVYDGAVRFVVQEYAGIKSDALNEGVGHAVVGQFFGRNLIFTVARPTGHTVTKSDSKLLLPDMETWMELAVEAAFDPKGTKAAELPLLRAAEFPTDARIKSWSFCDYLLRRQPNLLLELDWTSSARNPDGVREKFRSATGLEIEALEREWKDFWTGATPVLAALRNKQPALRAASKDAEKWLAEFNRQRAAVEAGPVGWRAAASQACQQHFEYLGNNRRARGPDAEQRQDTRLEGGTEAGSAFAQMALVSTKGTREMADWIDIPGYRDALVNPYLETIGIYAEGAIGVIDPNRGSVFPSGKTPSVTFPKPNSKGAPRSVDVKLLGPEVEAALEELGKKRVKSLGYPVSVHGFRTGGFPRDAKATVTAGGKPVEGFTLVGGGNRHTGAPGMMVFFPLESLPAGVPVQVKFEDGAGKQLATWTFHTK